jgi:DNA-binding LacI/PurR family transcriptional regulator
LLFLKMTHKVTIQDIAKAAGTSPSTVSRVLTGSARVSPAKRELIEAVIDRLHYRPSNIARSLKTSVTHSVGLLINDITNPFYGAVARGVEEEAAHRGYSLILCNTNEDPEREQEYLQVLQDKRVDGIILGPSGQNAAYICELAERLPVVQVDRRVDCANLAAVLVDNEEGAYKATRLLIDKGHRRIGLVKWQKSIATMNQRYAAYKRALCDAALPLEESLVVSIADLDIEATARTVQILLQSAARPTAVFALNNQLGLGVLSAIQHVGLKIPDDVALVIFDDLPFFGLLKPSITAVRQPAFEIGEQAMRLLHRQMEQTDNPLHEVVILPTELIVRESA